MALRYTFVWVGFLKTLCPRVSLDLLYMKISRKGNPFGPSSSIVNLILGNKLFKTIKKSFKAS